MNYREIAKYSRHGGAYDRGSADSYYGRECDPHYFTGDTYRSTEILKENMTEEEIAAYMEGYTDTPFGHKFWG